MLDPHYVNPRLVELYDLTCGWSPDRDFYLSLAGTSPKRVLDMGCGTGLLCDAYAAAGHAVTGVDPAAAMLDIARRKPHGSVIEWVQSPAQAYRSEKRFDLIIMTGHAFQVLLDDDDILAAFATMRLHLGPDGSIAFEARNPAIDWTEIWDGDNTTVEFAGQPVHVTTRVLGRDGERLAFEQHYAFPDETLISPSVLRFLTRGEIEERLAAGGLRVESLYGNWNAQPFDEAASEEMVFIVRAA